MKNGMIALVTGLAMIAVPLGALADEAKSPAPVPATPTTQMANAPLPAGAAAGVKKAQAVDDDNIVLIAGGVLILAGAALALSSNGSNGGSSTTTGTAP